MGLTIILQDERGRREGTPIEDPKGLLNRLLPRTETDAFRYLPYIDPYGDTIFNSIQMEPFLREWREMRKNTSTADERAIVDSVEVIAVRCQETNHSYLRFVGD
jgi:hypothetical protein